MEALLNELRRKIVDILDLVDIRPDDIRDDDPLLGDELGIDSIDILELVIMIDKDYGLKIDNKKLGEQVFPTLKTMATYIYDNSPRLAR